MIVAAAVMALAGREIATNVMLAWVVLGCLWTVSGRIDIALSLIAFAIPMEQAFYAWGDGRWNTIPYLLGAMLVLRWLVRPSHTFAWRRWTTPEVWFILWLVWAVVSLAWSTVAADGRMLGLVTRAGGLLVFVAFYREAQSKEVVLRWLWFFVAGVLVMTIAIAYYYQPGMASIVEMTGRTRQNAFGSEIGSHVKYARMAAAAAIASLALWQLEARRSRKAMALALAITFSIGVLLSASRANMLALSLGLLVWLYFSPSLTGKLRNAGLVFLMLISGLNVALMVNADVVTQRYEQTVSASDVARASSGRTEIWPIGMEMFWESPVLGVGYGAFVHEYSRRTGDARGRADHNEFLAAFAETGLIGGLIFLLFMLGLLRAAWRARNWRNTAVGLWIVFATGFFFSGAGNLNDFAVMMAVILAASAGRLGRAAGNPPSQLARGEHRYVESQI